MAESVRIDKWLWAARFFKTRAKATEAVAGGRVRLDGEGVKPARHVRRADVVQVTVGDTDWTVVVLGVAEKRGSAQTAAALYAETPESIADRACRRKTPVVGDSRCPGRRAAPDKARSAPHRRSASWPAGDLKPKAQEYALSDVAYGVAE
jgi:ribosome-associated heat shock protein Hsp15